MPGKRIRNFLAWQRLTLLGGLFMAAGSAVAYGDAGYPFLSVAFAALLGLTAIAALVLAVPFAFRPAARAAFFAIGLTFFLDVAYIGGGPVASAATVLLAGYLVYLIAWRGSDTVVPFAATAVAVSVVFILPQQASSNTHLAPDTFELAKAGADSRDRRPYVHIILDAMSPLGMMPKGPFYDALKRRMSEDYRRRGFDLFQDTVASAGATVLSLGHVFADNDGERRNFTEADGAFSYVMNENRAVDRFAAAGYGITMLQSNYLELCDTRRAHCMTYARSGDGGILLQRAKSVADGVGYALRNTNMLLRSRETTRSSSYYQMLDRLGVYLGLFHPPVQHDFARPPLAISLMEKAVRPLGQLRNGEAVFLHLLVPHTPYVLDEQCRMKASDQAFMPRWITRQAGIEFDAAATERAYWEQAACTHDKLMAMIDAILASPGGRNAVIVVHGDHGSRLFKKLVHPEEEAASETERRHALLAHFAVRGLGGRHDELAAHHTLRERVSIVLNAVLGDSSPDPDLVTSSMH